MDIGSRVESRTRTLDEGDLERLTNHELDDIFRASPAGELPAGVVRGTAYVFNGTRACRIIAKLAYWFAWQGKKLDPDRRGLVNRITPLRLPLIRATVYHGSSWVDDKRVHRHRLLEDVGGRADGARRDATRLPWAAPRSGVALASPRGVVLAARAAVLTRATPGGVDRARPDLAGAARRPVARARGDDVRRRRAQLGAAVRRPLRRPLRPAVRRRGEQGPGRRRAARLPVLHG